MQQQRKPDAKESTGSQKTSKQPLSKRGVSVLLLLWGVMSTLFLIPLMREGSDHYPEDYIATAAILLQGVFCLFGGLFSLLRQRSAARFCLYAIAVSWMLLGVAMAVQERHAGSPAQVPIMLAISLAIFLFGAAFLLLARWLSSQDDDS